MVGDSDKDRKGFSGLSDLASEISGIDEPIKRNQKAKTRPSTSKHRSQAQRRAARSKPKWKTTHTPPPTETVSSGNDGGGSEGKWMLAIFGIIFVIWLIYSAGQSNRTPSYTPSRSSQNSSHPQSTSAPVVETPSTTQNAGLQYTKPSVGTNNVLSISEIRWCIREAIRSEAMRDVIDTNAGIAEFNRIIENYNRRCSSYQYRRGSQARAERDVDPYRGQIVSEAVREAQRLNYSSRAEDLSPSWGRSTQRASKQPSKQLTVEAQKRLADLGYNPGPIDGDLGPRTIAAVKSFQRDIDIPIDGRIDFYLLKALAFTIDQSGSTCQFKGVMSDEDYRNCGLEPPVSH